MSRSRRMTGKPTVKQIDTRVSTIEKEFHGFANAAATDLMKVNRLLYAVMEDMGKLEKLNCASCGEEILRPNLDGLEQTEDCPACGRNIYGSDQTTLDDLQKGMAAIKEEE